MSENASMEKTAEKPSEIALPPQLDAIDKQLVAISACVRAGCSEPWDDVINSQIDSARAQLRAMAHTSQLISAGLRASTREPRSPSTGMPPTFGGVTPLNTSAGDADAAERERSSPLDRL